MKCFQQQLIGYRAQKNIAHKYVALLRIIRLCFSLLLPLGALWADCGDSMAKFAKLGANAADQSQRVEHLLTAVDDLKAMPQNIRRICGTKECSPSQLERLGIWIGESLRGTCVAKSPVAQKNIRDGLLMAALSFSSAFALNKITDEETKISDFPFEFLISAVVWINILGEVDCRAELNREKLAPESSRWKRIQAGIANSRAYFIIVPVGAAGDLLISNYADKLRGKAEESQNSSARLGFFLFYDTVFATMKRILIMRPLFFRLYPYMESVVENLGKSKFLAGAALQASNYGLRQAIATTDTWLFLQVNQCLRDISYKGDETRLNDPPAQPRAASFCERVLRKTITSIGEEGNPIPPQDGVP